MTDVRVLIRETLGAFNPQVAAMWIERCWLPDLLARPETYRQALAAYVADLPAEYRRLVTGWLDLLIIMGQSGQGLADPRRAELDQLWRELETSWHSPGESIGWLGALWDVLEKGEPNRTVKKVRFSAPFILPSGSIFARRFPSTGKVVIRTCPARTEHHGAEQK